jgi:multiple antibiotic resistance protein
LLEVVKSTILILAGLFPIVNPLGNSPIFLAMTRDYPTSARALLSRQIALNSFILLVASFFIGTHVLSFFGISLPVVQVGGGLVVISTGWTMLKQADDDDEKESGARRNLRKRDIFRQAFYPLTLPITVGPGSISVAIALGANEPRHLGLNVPAAVAALIGSVLIAVSIYICYRFAELLCIGVQILWNGVRGLLSSLSTAGH